MPVATSAIHISNQNFLPKSKSINRIRKQYSKTLSKSKRTGLYIKFNDASLVATQTQREGSNTLWNIFFPSRPSSVRRNFFIPMTVGSYGHVVINARRSWQPNYHTRHILLFSLRFHQLPEYISSLQGDILKARIRKKSVHAENKSGSVINVERT